MRKIETEEDLHQVIELRESVRNSANKQMQLVEKTWPGSLRGDKEAKKKSLPINQRQRMWDLLKLNLFEITALRHQMRILDYFLLSRKDLTGPEISADLAKTRILSTDQLTMVAGSSKPLAALRLMRKQVGAQIEALAELRGQQHHMHSQMLAKLSTVHSES